MIRRAGMMGLAAAALGLGAVVTLERSRPLDLDIRPLTSREPQERWRRVRGKRKTACRAQVDRKARKKGARKAANRRMKVRR